ncbi:MAG: hypothetical protein ACRC8Y_20595 [Chroococcales cyanobacterium]
MTTAKIKNMGKKIAENQASLDEITLFVSLLMQTAVQEVIAFLISIRYSPHPKPLSQDGRGALKST